MNVPFLQSIFSYKPVLGCKPSNEKALWGSKIITNKSSPRNLWEQKQYWLEKSS